MIRRSTSYGPPLPPGVLDDDGAERGIVFVFIGAHLDRQFEFVKSQWLNDGSFIVLDQEKDLLAGDNDGTGTFTIPRRPIRRRLQRRRALCASRVAASTASCRASVRCDGWRSLAPELKAGPASLANRGFHRPVAQFLLCHLTVQVCLVALPGGRHDPIRPPRGPWTRCAIHSGCRHSSGGAVGWLATTRGRPDETSLADLPEHISVGVVR